MPALSEGNVHTGLYNAASNRTQLPELDRSVVNGENRLLFVDSSAGRSSYLSSADGLRQSAAEPPNTPNSGKSYLVWDLQNLLLRYNGAPSLEDRYTDYPGHRTSRLARDSGGLASHDRSGGTTLCEFDPQGSRHQHSRRG